MEAQPLILPNANTARGTRDVLVLPSMADIVRGVDAHDGYAIWQVTLGVPVTGSRSIDFHLINQFWGCLPTGVIDPDTQRLYQVCWVWRRATLPARYGHLVRARLLPRNSPREVWNGPFPSQRRSAAECLVLGGKTRSVLKGD
jgi:hypothetical protein